MLSVLGIKGTTSITDLYGYNYLYPCGFIIPSKKSKHLLTNRSCAVIINEARNQIQHNTNQLITPQGGLCLIYSNFAFIIQIQPSQVLKIIIIAIPIIITFV